jgi:hypothetical protein
LRDIVFVAFIACLVAPEACNEVMLYALNVFSYVAAVFVAENGGLTTGGLVALCMGLWYMLRLLEAAPYWDGERTVVTDMLAVEAGELEIEQCLELIEGEIPVSRTRPGHTDQLVGACVLALKIQFGGSDGILPIQSAAVQVAAREWLARRLRREHPSLRVADLHRALTRSVPLMWVASADEVYASHVDTSAEKLRRNALLTPAGYHAATQLVWGGRIRGLLRW